MTGIQFGVLIGAILVAKGMERSAALVFGVMLILLCGGVSVFREFFG